LAKRTAATRRPAPERRGACRRPRGAAASARVAPARMTPETGVASSPVVPPRGARARIILAVLESGTRLGPYVVESPLGSGGMGSVYRARDTRLERAVAIKVLAPQVAAD